MNNASYTTAYSKCPRERLHREENKNFLISSPLHPSLEVSAALGVDVHRLPLGLRNHSPSNHRRVILLVNRELVDWFESTEQLRSEFIGIEVLGTIGLLGLRVVLLARRRLRVLRLSLRAVLLVVLGALGAVNRPWSYDDAPAVLSGHLRRYARDERRHEVLG